MFREQRFSKKNPSGAEVILAGSGGRCTILTFLPIMGSRAWSWAAAVFLQSLAGVRGSCGLLDLAGLGAAVGMLATRLGEG